MDTVRDMDYEEKRRAHGFVKETTTSLAQYMSRAIEAANREYQVSDQEFWKNLFCGTDQERRTVIERSKLGNRCPPNPYQLLDLQGCNKYLLFGGRRVVGEKDGQPVFAVDSLNFFKKFQVEYFQRAYKGRNGQWKTPGPKREYSKVLSEAILVRNKYAHDSEGDILNVTLESLEADLRVLEQLTEPTRRHPGWEGDLCPVEDYWAETKRRFKERFGSAPISVEEITRELFMVEEEITPEQLSLIHI